MIKAYSVVAAGVGLGLAALGGAIGMGHTAELQLQELLEIQVLVESL